MNMQDQQASDPLDAHAAWRGIVVVIPSISPNLIEEARPALRRLSRAGADVVVAANSAGVAALSGGGDFRVVDLRRNSGYSAAINAAADAADAWEWLLALNDDLDFSAPKLDLVHRSMRDSAGELILFDTGPWR